MAKPVSHVQEFPLFFDPTAPLTDINYMRDVRKDEWNIAKLQAPLYLYQPEVEPTPDGGRVTIELPQRKKPPRSEFIEVKKSQTLDPKEQPWSLVTKDGRVFRGTRDTLTNSAILYQTDDGFHIQLIDHSLRFFEEHLSKDITDADKAIQRMDEEERRKKRPSFLMEAVAQEEKLREARARRIKEMHLDEGSDADDGYDEEGSEKEGEIDFNGKEEFEDDEGVDGEPIDDLADLFEWSDKDDDLNNISDDEEEEGEEGEGKRKKKQTVSAVVVNDQPGTEAPMTAEEKNQQIVTTIFGEEEVKEAELRRYMMDVGMCTIPDLRKKFKSKLKTLQQREAFQNLVRRLLVKEQRANTAYVKLKRPTPSGSSRH
jgi:hypothetical protein